MNSEVLFCPFLSDFMGPVCVTYRCVPIVLDDILFSKLLSLGSFCRFVASSTALAWTFNGAALLERKTPCFSVPTFSYRFWLPAVADSRPRRVQMMVGIWMPSRIVGPLIFLAAAMWPCHSPASVQKVRIFVLWTCV
jgi:hypothetical protein